jgi:hypothetical protein
MNIRLHLLPGFDDRYLPYPAERRRDWWEVDPKTQGHAVHCHPLVIANSLGWTIPSPATITVDWDGILSHDAQVTLEDAAPHAVVDAHSAGGSFTVQARFIPRTDNVGEMVWIRPVPNRRDWWTPMDALIEAWWNPGEMGIVCLVNAPGRYRLEAGTPLAQMVPYHADAGFSSVEPTRDAAPDHAEWSRKRSRPDYMKDHDYRMGRHPDGDTEPAHVRSWRARPAELPVLVPREAEVIPMWTEA